jgi:hypothetical protein
MKLFVSWIVIWTLAASSVMAQGLETIPVTAPIATPEDTSVPLALPAPTTDLAFREVTSSSTAPAIATNSAAQIEGSEKPQAAGKSSWLILAALAATVVTVAAILFLRNRGHDEKSQAAGPAGTILSPGTPAVGTSPNR